MRKTIISLLLSFFCYFLSAGNPFPVKVLSNTLTIVPSGYVKASNISFEVKNLSKTLDLKGNVGINWFFIVDGNEASPRFSGFIAPECPPGETCTSGFMVDLFDDGKPSCIKLQLVNLADGSAITEKTYPLTAQ